VNAWNDAKPETRALVIVVTMGAIGAVLACWWNVNIGEKDFASGIAKLPILLRICLGGFGATVAVFVLAKTDTSKLIHCGILAALFGMAGPYLVIKALSAVVSVSPSLVQVGGAISVVQSTTIELNNGIQKLNNPIQGQTTGTNPQKIVDLLDQTAQATASYLNILKSAPQDEKRQALESAKSQLQETFKTLNVAAGIAPKESVALIRKVATQATEAGAPELAQEAQKILETNPAVRAAAENTQISGKVYFITPSDLTDNILSELSARIREKFQLADIQPAVHPTRSMEPGLEFVYYRDAASDRQIATELSMLVNGYLKERKIVAQRSSVRKGSTEQTPPPFQFDIHIGQDVASRLGAEITKSREEKTQR
jgi:hypothetical protein